MANFTPSTSNTVTAANAGTSQNSGTAVFIPELWSDEIIAAYEKNLVLANLVNRMPMTGKKGDTLYIPKPDRGSASAKDVADTVTLQQSTNTRVAVVVDQHYEYSRLIEDIVDVQAMDSLRQFYTQDAGYALATQIDNDLFALGKSLGNGTGANFVHDASFQIGASNVLEAFDDDGAGDLGAFTDTAFRNMIQKLDDANVPMDARALIIPPSIRNVIMGEQRYSSRDFVDSGVVENGKIGQLYGVDIYVTTNCPATGTAATGIFLLHKDAFVLAEQMGVRSQTQYKQEYLATLFTSDTLYGVKTLRPEAGIVVSVA